MGFLDRIAPARAFFSREETVKRELQYAAAVQIWQANALASLRATLDLAVAWRVAVESPEIDVRDDLDAMIEKLSDEVARIEEHIV